MKSTLPDASPRTLLVGLIDFTIETLLERDGWGGEAEALKLIASAMFGLDNHDQIRLLAELLAISLQGRIDRRIELNDLVRVPDPLERRWARWTPDREREWQDWLRTFDA